MGIYLGYLPLKINTQVFYTTSLQYIKTYSFNYDVFRLLITVNENFFKSMIYKNRMIIILCQFKIEFIVNAYLEVKGKYKVK